MVTRCRNQPVTGITAAMVSMNAVDTHCADCSVTCSESISRGIALTMMVSLRITTKVASTSRRTTVGVRWTRPVDGGSSTAVMGFLAGVRGVLPVQTPGRGGTHRCPAAASLRRRTSGYSSRITARLSTLRYSCERASATNSIDTTTARVAASVTHVSHG